MTTNHIDMLLNDQLLTTTTKKTKNSKKLK